MQPSLQPLVHLGGPGPPNINFALTPALKLRSRVANTCRGHREILDAACQAMCWADRAQARPDGIQRCKKGSTVLPVFFRPASFPSNVQYAGPS